MYPFQISSNLISNFVYSELEKHAHTPEKLVSLLKKNGEYYVSFLPTKWGVVFQISNLVSD